jgi:hypothetical protein
MKKLTFIVLLLLVTSIVKAGPGTGAFTIKEVRVESGSVYIFPEKSIDNVLNCGGSSPIKLENQDLGYQEMYSQVLAAVASGKKIRMWLRKCATSPWGRTTPKAYASGLLAN